MSHGAAPSAVHRRPGAAALRHRQLDRQNALICGVAVQTIRRWRRRYQRRPFLRGLFHSDGARVTNWTTRPVGGVQKRYGYPRYFFTNDSEDILGLCTWAPDLLGIPWRWHGRSVSVARRAGVAAPDAFVGSKR
jgi:hypothetical protein